MILSFPKISTGMRKLVSIEQANYIVSRPVQLEEASDRPAKSEAQR